MKRETTDGRYIEVDNDAWWDTDGIEIVPESTVILHMIANPRVGLVILERH